MKYKQIAGYMDYQDLYSDFVKELQTGNVFVEVGSYLGKSLIFFLEMMKRHKKDIIVCSVDHFKGTPNEPLKTDFYEEFLDNIESCGYSEDVSIYKMTSEDAAYKFPNQLIDICFIDANHEYEEVKKDINLWLPKVKPGGILAGHDIDFPGVWRAVNECLPEFYVNNRCWIYRKP